MIEVMTTVATGVCQNCQGKISLMYGDLSSDIAVWYHDANGKNTCPNAPVAVPTNVRTRRDGR